MVKKGLILSVMVAVWVVIILCLVGSTRMNQKSKLEKTRARIVTPQKPQEIKIVAVEEKVSPVPKPVVPRAKNRGKPNQLKKYVAAQKTTTRKSEKTDPRPKKLFPAKLRLNNHMVVVGRKLIDENSSVPIVQASYDQIGFESYLRKMMKIGGRLFVGDARGQRILAEVILGSTYGTHSSFWLDTGKKDELDGMALFRPREISGERLVNKILNYSRQFFENSDLRCVVLLPLDKEAVILGALEEYLNESGYHISQFDTIWAHYVQTRWQFGLKVERGRLSKSQEIVYMNMILTM